jgi:tRNA(fMet)-specific endonuclease VapC
VKVLLDTNAYSDLGRGHQPLSDRVRLAEAVLLSSVVAGELLGGFRRGSRFSENLADLERFLAQPRVHVLPVTWTTADRYSRIYAALRRRGRPIPTNDMWIAAHAMETGAELLSSDPHFQHVDGLAWLDTGGPTIVL